MEQIFSVGQSVRFNDSIVASAPAYAGKNYNVLAATADWEIGSRNEWYGDYLIEDADGERSVTRQSCLVPA